MTASERAQELKSLLQMSYDMAERVSQLLREKQTLTVYELYTDLEKVSCLLDKALKESLYGSY